jgi:hypothetical protein
MHMRKQLSLKAIYLALTILVLAAGHVSAQSPSMRGPQFKIKVYSGASILPYFTSGLRDVHITSFPADFLAELKNALLYRSHKAPAKASASGLAWLGSLQPRRLQAPELQS